MSGKKREKRKSGTLTEMQRGERERERERERSQDRVQQDSGRPVFFKLFKIRLKLKLIFFMRH